MPEFWFNLWSSGPFIPHGHCYLWNPDLVWLHVLSDVLIALAYYSIPLTLFYFVQKRQDLPFPQVFFLFGIFFVACGTTHLMEVWTLWHPTYWLSGAIKALTAAISLYTVVIIIPLVPKALALPSPVQMELATEALTVQMAERERAETSLRLAYNDLDQRIQARTLELAQANQVLQTEIAERQRTEALLQTFIDNAGSVIYIKNVQGQYILINRQYETLFHLDRIAVKGKTDHDIFPPDIADVFRENDLQVLAAGKVQESEELAPQDDGRHTYLSIKFPLLDATGSPYAVCGISTDITERKQAEAALAQQTEELARSNAELERFAYVASHDLQEPLRMVVSYLQLLERRYQGKLDTAADEFIAYAVDGAARMQTLIQDLLSYSRVGTQAQAFTVIDSEAVLGMAITNLQMAIAESGATITHDPLPTVVANASQLVQLLQNLIGNAIKFRSEQPPQIHISAKRLPEAWQFAVRDNGIGIEPEYTERIFIIFQRLHRRADYPGTGIGLAICRKIVERHGGRLWLESEPGQGSVFYFTLPERTVPY